MEIIQGTSVEVKNWQTFMLTYKTEKQRKEAIQEKQGGIIYKISDEKRILLKHKTNVNTKVNAKVTQQTSELKRKLKYDITHLIDSNNSI